MYIAAEVLLGSLSGQGLQKLQQKCNIKRLKAMKTTYLQKQVMFGVKMMTNKLEKYNDNFTISNHKNRNFPHSQRNLNLALIL